MKRKQEAADADSLKRQRNDGDHYAGQNPVNRQGQHGYTNGGLSQKNKPNYGQGHKQSNNGGPRNDSFGGANGQSATPAFTDPLSSLENILVALTAQPKDAETILGRDAIDHAQQLLKAVSARQKAATPSLDLFQPGRASTRKIPAYYAGTHIRSVPLPPLPELPEGPYSTAPFTHKSVSGGERVISSGTSLSYESLEFLGDAYLETIATRLIFARYSHLASGRQAQIRELLIKNETLMGFSRAYSFHKRLDASEHELNSSIKAGNKGLGKILADVFEAYVAAIILSDPETGFERVEIWLTELWAPILLQHYGPESQHAREADYNTNAKMELQKRIGAVEVRIEYLDEKVMQQSKHAQRYFVAVYLTGWTYQKERLGYGEGQNKTEAGNRAAMDAMGGAKRTVVEQCEEKLRLRREERNRVRQAQEGSG